MPSLREALTTAYDIADEGGDLTVEALREPVETEVEQPETAQQKAERTRDEAGKFAKEPKEKATKPAPSAQPQDAAPLERPKSWKKDYEPHWQKLITGQALTPDEAKALAQYNREREDQFTNGVTTYKQVAEQAKPILDVIAPYMPALQKAGITADQEVKMLLNAHHTLALGSPQERLRMFAQLANDYGVDLRVFGQQGQPQQQQLPPQFEQIMQALNQSQAKVQQYEARLGSVENVFLQQQLEQAQSFVEKFGDDKPYFDRIRNQMADVMDKASKVGIEMTLDEAHDLVLSKDKDIQSEIRAAQEQQSRQAKTLQVQAARKQAVSPKSSAPTAMTSGTRPKGRAALRETLSEAFDVHTSGRV
jgi:hypothetical protein